MENVRKPVERETNLSPDELRKKYPEFARLLLDRQRELLGREKVTRLQLDEQTLSAPGDVADLSVIDTSADYFLKLASNQQKELIEIRDALDRMHRGVYGMCTSCQEPIALERLRRLPYARLCIDCQSNSERKNRVSHINPAPKL